MVNIIINIIRGVHQPYYYSGQNKEMSQIMIKKLQKETNRIRLVLSTSVSGMGFDPPRVTCDSFTFLESSTKRVSLFNA